jgi:hypothetical protein
MSCHMKHLCRRSSLAPILLSHCINGIPYMKIEGTDIWWWWLSKHIVMVNPSPRKIFNNIIQDNIIKLNNSMELSTTQETNNCVANWQRPAFYGIKMFTTTFPRALQLSITWTSPIQSTPLHPISKDIFSYPPTYISVFLVVSFPLAFPTNNIYTFHFSPFMLHTPPIYNDTWPRVQITKILVMQLSPPSHHSSLSGPCPSCIVRDQASQAKL